MWGAGTPHPIGDEARGTRSRHRRCSLARSVMRPAGLDITDDLVLNLVTRLRRADFADQADTLEGALVTGQAEVALTIPERVAILTVLDDPPKGLAQLRAVLLEEQVWRKREGM